MSNISDLVKAAIKANAPTVIWGAPGIGKTALVRSIAADLGVTCVTVIASHYDAGELAGIRYVAPNGDLKTQLAPWLRELLANPGSILFLDEISCARPETQSVLLRLLTDRVIADVNVAGHPIVAAANPSDTAADGGFLRPATANRLVHLTHSVVASDWLQGQSSNWGQFSPSSEFTAANSLVCEFIRRKPESLLAVPSDLDAAGLAWPSPRTWSNLVGLLAAAGTQSPLVFALATSCVGSNVAKEFYTFAKSFDLVDPEEILSGAAKFPKRSDLLYAAVNAVAGAATMEHQQREARIRSAWLKLTALDRKDIVIGAAKVLLSASCEVPVEASNLGAEIYRLSSGGAA